MDGSKKQILFNGTKRETHDLSQGFKKMARKLKNNYSVATNHEEISNDVLQDASMMIFGSSRESFTDQEFKALKSWLDSGGRALFLTHEGGDKTSGSNMNKFLSEFGIVLNDDSVLRNVHYKYLHPKEVFIGDSVLVPDLISKKNIASTSLSTGKSGGSSNSGNEQDTKTKKNKNSNSDNDGKLNIVFPYGSTMRVQKPARSLLSSGLVSYPSNASICSIWESETVQAIGGKRGRLVTLGSTEIFSDEWIEKEENNKLCDLLLAWLLDVVELDMVSERKDDIASENPTNPNIESLSQTIKPCLQGLEDLPVDFTKLFDLKMYQFDVEETAKTVDLYKDLNVPHHPLTLIAPQFECPLPKMFPATFPPALKDLPPPSLDLFDLDENFAPTETRLAQLTNKCTAGADDLEYFVTEAGNILNVLPQLNQGQKNAKQILFHVFSKIVRYKCSNPQEFQNTGSDDMMSYVM